jgi:hypothetical protein
VTYAQASQTLGPKGPILLQDFNLIDLLAHFDRERIPERVVHAKGAGAFGEFEVTHDITDIVSLSDPAYCHRLTSTVLCGYLQRSWKEDGGSSSLLYGRRRERLV